MPTKFQLITELYDQTVQSVTGSYQSWTGFLRAACYNYKCPFDDQILIYAQRPDATAVLEMERWNRQFGRWVNRGAKSIAVFGDDGQNCLKLYFDVSDTHASRFARPLPIWTMHPAFEPEVIETLEATFGNLAEKRKSGGCGAFRLPQCRGGQLHGLPARPAGVSGGQPAGGTGRPQFRGVLPGCAGGQRGLYADDPAGPAGRRLFFAR